MQNLCDAGELIGVEYLFAQTNKPLQEYGPDDADGDDENEEDEWIKEEAEDLTLPSIEESSKPVTPPESKYMTSKG